MGVFMKRFLPLLVIGLLGVPLLNGCTTMRSGKAVPAAYESEKQGSVTKYIPGLQSLSNLLPPPSEARTNWDQWYKKQSDPWKSRDGQ
jgi:hypothetical protein